MSGGARLGKESSVLISIGPNDSPLGSFGFEALMVNGQVSRDSILTLHQFKCNHLTLSSQVTVSEPQFGDDPASVATLTVVRSPLGEGTVHLTWLLEEKGWGDLTPPNGTITFNQV